MKKMILAALLVLTSQSVFANSVDNCASEADSKGAHYKVIVESDGSRTALLVAFERNGKILGSDRTEDVKVYLSHGLRRIDSSLHSVQFGKGQPQLTLLKTGETFALVCQ